MLVVSTSLCMLRFPFADGEGAHAEERAGWLRKGGRAARPASEREEDDVLSLDSFGAPRYVNDESPLIGKVV